MSTVKNITIEAMENENIQTPQQQKNTNAFDAKNYLNVKLDADKGETKKEIKIRILPIDKDSDTPFKTIYMHTVKVDKKIASNGWKSYVCLEKTGDIDHDKYGTKCPFCELNRLAYKKSTETNDLTDQKRWKEISLSNIPTEVCVIRCVERGHEEDGPKFWKFSVRKDGTDPKNTIKRLYNVRKEESINDALEEYGVSTVNELPDSFTPDNILDLYEGKDLTISIQAVFDKNGVRTNKTSISIIDSGNKKPLARSQETIDKLVNDEKVWSDVFVAKTYDYLKIIMDGKIPYFDKTKKCWVEQSQKNDNTEVQQNEQRVQAAQAEIINETSQFVEDDEEDLPF
jgi:hypothetical protein